MGDYGQIHLFSIVIGFVVFNDKICLATICDDFGVAEEDGACYWVPDQKYDILDGSTACGIYGGIPARVILERHLTFLDTFFDNHHSDKEKIYIGVHQATNGSYKGWLGATVSPYAINWDLGQPVTAYSCVVTVKTTGYKWETVDCSEKYYIACSCSITGVAGSYCHNNTIDSDVTVTVTLTGTNCPTSTETVVKTMTETSCTSTTSSYITKTETFTETISNTCLQNSNVLTSTVSGPTSTVTSSSSTSSTSSSSTYLSGPNILSSQSVNIGEMVENLKKAIQIDKRQTNVFLRKFYSAGDPRVSSAIVGYVGAISITGVAVTMVALDLPVLLQTFKETIIRFKGLKR